ncbi:MAG: recombination-associated protein RdgC [Desulfoprunum sp.]|nr:recombination-associated protein RdgC [Desulfoprunum sp.]
MGFVKGSASFVRFSVEGDLPNTPLEFIADRVASFSFRDIDETFDEYSIGWVSVLNMFDAKFQYASYICGDYVTLSVRMDERKVSSAILKKVVQKEEERIKKERQIPKIGRSLKVEIKERVHTELMRKAVPLPSVYDLCWNLSDSTLLFFTTNKKAHAVLEDLFKDSFGLLIRQQIPYVTGEQLLGDDQIGKLASISPIVFI